VCVLASGDPMFFGVGVTIIRLLGPDQVHVLPHASSVSLACARLGWPLEQVEIVSLVGRPLDLLAPAVVPGNRVLVLSSDGSTPADVAKYLAGRGYGASELTVLEQLGSDRERLIHGTAESWHHEETAALNVVGVCCRPDPGAVLLPRVPGLPDEAYDHDGQLTKREVRAVSMSRLCPAPGQLLWDVGAGAGSIGIEWMRSHPTCRAVAVERDDARAARIERNAAVLGVPHVRVVNDEAPTALAGLDVPDAVFVGGGVTTPGVMEACWDALTAGGRLVANAVTVESELVLADWRRRYGGDLTRLAVQRAAPIGGFTGWRPMMPVTIFAVTRT
jgi:precorrin-6B C5,15-methyltransferase / cobalt-precorrin-6B C5,C15-methyltransferase